MAGAFQKRDDRRADEEWRQRVGASIRDARKSQRFSQAQLASRAGVDAGAISDIEIGKTDPTFSMLEAIADVLECPLDQLVGRKLEPGRSPLSPGGLRVEMPDAFVYVALEIAPKPDAPTVHKERALAIRAGIANAISSGLQVDYSFEADAAPAVSQPDALPLDVRLQSLEVRTAARLLSVMETAERTYAALLLLVHSPDVPETLRARMREVLGPPQTGQS